MNQRTETYFMIQCLLWIRMPLGVIRTRFLGNAVCLSNAYIECLPTCSITASGLMQNVEQDIYSIFPCLPVSLQSYQWINHIIYVYLCHKLQYFYAISKYPHVAAEKPKEINFHLLCVLFRWRCLCHRSSSKWLSNNCSRDAAPIEKKTCMKPYSWQNRWHCHYCSLLCYEYFPTKHTDTSTMYYIIFGFQRCPNKKKER